MKRIDFTIEKDGFYGAYFKCKNKTNSAIIACIGDDCKDYMTMCCVKWIMSKRNVNVLTMSPNHKDYSHHNYPLERVLKAINFLNENGNDKIGIIGASTTATLALTCASYFKQITLTIALTPSDFIWQGFMQGKKDGYTEWPIENESLFTYQGKELPYMPFCYKHPEYGKVMAEEAKNTKNMLASCKLFDDSEKAHPIQEDEFIKVENINGILLLIGARDDSLWNTAKYIKRMEKRLNEKPHKCEVIAKVYDHGTHFVFPDGLLKKVFPVFNQAILKLVFKAAKDYPHECKETRIDIEKQVLNAIDKWQMNIE